MKTDALNEKIDLLWTKKHKQDLEIDRLKTKASLLSSVFGVVFGALSGWAVKYLGG